MTTVPDLHRLCDLLEVSRGPAARALVEVVGVPPDDAGEALADAGLDPETPAAALTTAEVARVRSLLVRPRREGERP